jgi:two-component system CheB/CheR fusion protein
MPQSLAPNTVDIVANLDAIGPLLQDLATGQYTPSRSDDRPLHALLEQLRDRSGIDFNSYKMPTILRRLQRRMVATGTERLNDYLRYIGNHPEEYRRLVSSFLIKVTEFYRDPDLFRYLEEEVLPGLIDSARQTGNELRLWSAGCATGEEAYSLALMLVDLLGDLLEQVHVRIFATDLDIDAINFARRGVYPASALAHLPSALIERHFNRLGDEYEIKKRVRSLVIFGQHDLGQRAPFPRIDLALCRNVLIYFTPELQRRALQLFAFSLRENGHLVLGKAESTSPLPQHFVLEEPRLKVYRRQGERVLIPPARIRDSAPLMPVRLVTGRRQHDGASLAAPRGLRDAQRPRTGSERAEHVLLRLPEGVIVVDRRYDIQSINSAARRMLAIHSSAIGEDFIHLAQSVPSTALRAAVDAAFRGQTMVTVFQVATAEVGSTEARYLQITCAPEKFDAETGPVESVVIIVADVSTVMRERRELEQTQARQQAESERLASLVTRLTETNRQLLEANEELTTTNAELRSSNEELLVANEEAQAATEEVETLNEELQATNEELETLNEELQATVEELNTTNDDLQARSVELLEMAAVEERVRRAAEAERARVEAILLSISDAVLVVDREGRTVLTNAAYAQMFGAPDADLAATDFEGAPLPSEGTPRQRAPRGESIRT